MCLKWVQIKEQMTTKSTEGSDIGSSQINQTPGLLEKIYTTPKASNFTNKEKADDNEPPDNTS